MKINGKFLAVAALLFAAGWLEAGGPRGACALPARACGYPVGYYAVTPFVYTSWSPILVYANTSGNFSTITYPTIASAAPVVDRVPPPVFAIPSVSSTEAFGWKH